MGYLAHHPGVFADMADAGKSICPKSWTVALMLGGILVLPGMSGWQAGGHGEA
jgi:hypothetical protein